MQLVVLLLYLVTLAMAITYAVGGVGLVIFLGLGAILTIECALLHRDRLRRAYSGPGHHHPAH